jgi:hypothetical protein
MTKRQGAGRAGTAGKFQVNTYKIINQMLQYIQFDTTPLRSTPTALRSTVLTPCSFVPGNVLQINESHLRVNGLQRPTANHVPKCYHDLDNLDFSQLTLPNDTTHKLHPKSCSRSQTSPLQSLLVSVFFDLIYLPRHTCSCGRLLFDHPLPDASFVLLLFRYGDGQ